MLLSSLANMSLSTMSLPVWALCLIIAEGLAIVVLFLLLYRQRRRHRMLARETARMLALHQDYAAGFDARLRALGSRTAGDAPVPGAAELIEGRWMR
jgi:hypothetical protein